jgi:hypothetical protein
LSYETTKERGATILLPSSMVDALDRGGVMALAGLGGGRGGGPGGGPGAGGPSAGVPPTPQKRRGGRQRSS